MARDLFFSITRRFAWRIPFFIYGTAWTAFLLIAVAVASFAPELAFVSVISPKTSSSRRCKTEGMIMVPLDIPGEVFCFPANLFAKSKIDLVVPPVFAAIVVAGSAAVVRTMGLWESDEAH